MPLPDSILGACNSTAFLISMTPHFWPLLEDESTLVKSICAVAKTPPCFSPTDEARAQILSAFWNAWEAACS